MKVTRYLRFFKNGTWISPMDHLAVAWLAAKLTELPRQTTTNWYLCPKYRKRLFISVSMRVMSKASSLYGFSELLDNLHTIVHELNVNIPAAMLTVNQLAQLAPHLQRRVEAMSIRKADKLFSSRPFVRLTVMVVSPKVKKVITEKGQTLLEEKFKFFLL